MSDNPVVRPAHNEFNTISHRLPSVSKHFSVRVMTISSTLLTASPTTTQNPTYYFTLSDLDEASSYTTLFDQYRIDAVVFKIIPMQNSITLQTNSTTTPVRLYCIVDYDDDNTLTSAAVARSYESCIMVPPGRECTRTFQPRAALAGYAGSFTGYTNVAGQWFDSASPSVRHYGIKLFVDGATTGQTALQSWTIERDYYFSFRKVHG